MKELKHGIAAMLASRVCRLFAILLCFFISSTRAQNIANSSALKTLLDKATARTKALPPEKVYLNFDKPYYAVGDTAWLKAYVLMDNHASAYSGKLYVELLNNNGKLMQMLTLPVANGLATGYFPLAAKTIAEDNYTIRAYTNWQQNFGAGSFFYRQFSVGKLGGKTWLVTEQNRRDNPADTNHVQLAMRFTDAKGLPLVTRKLNLRLLENGKPVLKSEIATGVDGTLTGGFSIPQKANRRALSIAVEDANDKEQHITFPFYPSGTSGDIDLQFMPEGGSLVAGLYNKTGFKAIGEDGLGRDIKGTVVDSKGEEAATLQSLHNGMGNFVLVPQAGETYTAKIMIDGRERKYPLPAAKAQGMALRVDGVTHADELYVYITGTAADDKIYTLVAQSAYKVYFGSSFKLNTDNYYNTRIKKDMFPTGIISLMILDPDNKPLNQRNVFVDHHDELKITAMPGQAAYGPKDSVSLNLHVANNAGKPVQANFSVAVTDDAQVKDAVLPDNIQSHMLLTSEIKGNIENPAWYFAQGTDADSKLKEKALDNLLLTQGWQGLEWTKLDAIIPQPQFKPEPDISITGSIKGLFKRSGAGIKVSVLANGKHPFYQDTVSDAGSRFAFHNLPLTDTVAYLLKLHNGKDRSVAADILVDEFTPTTASLAGLPRRSPWNMNTDTTLINYIRKTDQRNILNENYTPTDGKLLKQVDIKAKREIKYVGGEFSTELMKIDSAELIAAKKMSLIDLLRKKLPGFRETSTYANNIFSGASYHKDDQFVNGTMLINDIIADGVSVANPLALQHDVSAQPDGVNSSSDPEVRKIFHDNIKLFINWLGADDVKKISLYRGTQMFLVIETRSGHGAYMAVSHGTYAYRPPFMQLPRQFYSPKYPVKNALPDNRSTIHWEPNVVTDEQGNARVSFYAADKPSTYTIVIEGTDMQGHFGIGTKKISITQGTAELHK